MSERFIVCAKCRRTLDTCLYPTADDCPEDCPAGRERVWHKKDSRNALRPWAFAWLYDTLVPAAREVGYALALHGSMTRDLDLIACPWTDEAVSAEELISVITEVAGGFVYTTGTGDVGEPREGRDPAVKPHGRLAWAIHFHGQPFIDVSVMPRTARTEEATE